MTESYSRAANLLGALALAVCDRLREATEHLDDGLAASEPAALVTLAHYPGQSILTLGRTLGLTHSGAVRLAGRLEAVEQLAGMLDPGEVAALERLAARLLAGITTDRGSAHRICRLCDEPLCVGEAGCPVDQAAGA